jgi:hypothetical protein
MHGTPEHGRRRFLSRAALTLAAAELGLLGLPALMEGRSRQLASLGRATEWLNSPPLPATSLEGKTVLVQFGTYTCINWLRTLPYVRAWHQRYASALTVIGVHTPEFAFEKNVANVRRSIQQMRIGFPMVIDNDQAIWRAFDNQYWPAVYLLDGRGRVRHTHFGEGDYERTEQAMQKVLAETGGAPAERGVVSVTGSGIERPADWQALRTPEIYLGHERAQGFASPGGVSPGRSRA